MSARDLVDQLTEAVDQTNLCVVLRGGANGLEALLVADEKGRWSIPGGHIKGTENFAEAAKREVREETGLDVEPEPLYWAKHVARGPGRNTNLFYAVVSGDKGDSAARPGGGDVTKVRWTPLSNLGDLNGTDKLAIHVAANRVHDQQGMIESEVELAESLGYAVGTVAVPMPAVDGIYLRLEGAAADEYARHLKEWAESLNWPVTLVSSTLFESTTDTLSRASHQRRLTPTLEGLIFASDALWRYESVISPALQAGQIVIETGPELPWARISKRGMPTDLVNTIQTHIPQPLTHQVGGSFNLPMQMLLRDTVETLKTGQHSL